MRIWFAGSACILFDPVIYLVRVRMKKWKSLGGFHPKIAISKNKDERLCKEHELEDVSSLILDYEAVRMNADGLFCTNSS